MGDTSTRCDGHGLNAPGVFITFEGGDGAGKSTHMNFLVQQLRACGYQVLQLREPGGTPVGERLRQIVLDPANGEISDVCELYLYEAARAQLVSQVIAPALAQGTVVVCDRFTDSTLAYQAFGRGIDKQQVEQANALACQGVVPQRTVFMTTGEDASVGLARATKDRDADRLELAGIDFHTRVAQGYASLAQSQPERFRTVVTAACKAETARRVFLQVIDLFDKLDLSKVPFDSLDAESEGC